MTGRIHGRHRLAAKRTGQAGKGDFVHVVADEHILAADGNIDVKKLDTIVFDTAKYSYYAIGARVGTEFADGKKLK